MRPVSAALFLLATAAFSPAVTIWVDVNNTTGVEDGSAAHPWSTIQEGIDAAANGDEVVVRPGEYIETVTFEGSGITSDFTLRSLDPLDPDVVAATVINGNLDGDPDTPEGSVVTFSGDEDESCLLSGFTITGGNTKYGGGLWGAGTLAGISYAVVAGNRADDGGGISGVGSVVRCTVSGNSALGYGGGIDLCYGLIEGCTVSRNTARRGGGLAGCMGTIRDCRIMDNAASQVGGGLHLCSGHMTNCTILRNSTEGEGGGLANWSGLIEACEISDNTAAVCGGGVYWLEGQMTRTTLARNLAGRNGGGASECRGTMLECLVMANRADYGGGLRSWDGPIRGSTIAGNTADQGGGLCCCTGPITENMITGNTAHMLGGGIMGVSDVTRNAIIGNFAGDVGGGVLSAGHVIAANLIAHNTAQNIGGGVIAEAGYVHGNTIVNNVAGLSGGGIAATILFKAGQGRPCSEQIEILLSQTYQLPPPSVANCAVWGNQAPEDPQIWHDYPDESVVTYSCIQDWDAGGEGNTSANPMFVDFDGGDYRLLPSSPCIDSADGDSAPETDITGRARWDHPEVPNTGIGSPPYADMGAYESYLQTFTSPPGLLRRGWNLVSLPVDPAPHHPESVWGNQLAAGNILTGNLYGYINPTGYTEYTRTLTAMEHARGYWLRLRYPTTEDVVGEEPEGPISVCLELGWNLIGHPLPDDVLWHACLVRNGGQELHIPQAAWAGWIQEAAFGFSPGSGQYFRVPEYDPFLRAWRGYWVLAYVDGLDLVVP